MDEINAPALPHNLEAEQALLGALMFDNTMFERLPDGLKGHHFFEPFHQRLFDAICATISAGTMADPTLLSTRFSADPAFKQFGGPRYLIDMMDRAPPGYACRDYARQVMDLSDRRELIRVADEIKHNAPDPERSAKDLLADAEGALFSLAETGEASKGIIEFREAMRGAIDMAEAAYKRDGALAGLSTGLVDLDRKLGGLHPSDLLVLAGRPSMGKAQPFGAKILLADGTWRAMGDIRFGDALASIDGQPSVVTGVYPQGEREVFRVTLSDGRSTVACAEHLWTVDCSKWSERRRTLTTADIRAKLNQTRYQRRISLPMVDGRFGTDKALPLDPWLLGAILGNGGIAGTSVMFSTADASTLFRVQKVVGSERVRLAGDYDYRIVANDCSPEQNVSYALMALGLKGCHSNDKFVPAAYLSASREARLAVLQGLLDTDGWVETFGAVRIALASQQLAMDVQTLVRSLGGLCTISVKHPTFSYKGEKKAGLPSYVCNISHPDRASLMTLARKRRRCAEPMRFRAPTIVSVEPVGCEPVQCIAVSHPEHLYVTDDYIVTHNTALATNIAFHVAKSYRFEDQPDGSRKTTNGGRVLFYSLEMSPEQLASRILADAAGVSSDKIRKGEIDRREFARLKEAEAMLAEIPLLTDATGGIPIGKLAARARRQHRKTGLDLIIVDYLQLATTGDRGSRNRVEVISEITGGLKALAKELNVPIIALSQLSRQVEQREDKRPMLSDLRESGSIEQDADAVMFVFRESYYLSRAEPRPGSQEHLNWTEKLQACQGLAEVIIGKQRHGPIGTVRLSFNEDAVRFGNLAHEGPESQSFDYGNAA